MRPIACDNVLIENGKILLIRRAKDPFKGMWALPGGIIEDNESAEQCLVREMKEETGLDVKPIALIGLYSDPERDPRLMISAAYFVKRSGGTEKAGDDAKETKWFNVKDLPLLCADHAKIIADALMKNGLI
jgi:8-oxo-dGTP diphosphatase